MFYMTSMYVMMSNVIFHMIIKYVMMRYQCTSQFLNTFINFHNAWYQNVWYQNLTIIQKIKIHQIESTLMILKLMLIIFFWNWHFVTQYLVQICNLWFIYLKYTVITFIVLIFFIYDNHVNSLSLKRYSLWNTFVWIIFFNNLRLLLILSNIWNVISMKTNLNIII